MPEPSIRIELKLPQGATLTKQLSPGATINELTAECKAPAEILVAKVDGKLADLTTPLNESASVELLAFDSPDGRDTFWHSSAHVLGQALQNLYSCLLVNGPPIEEGFYYDVYASRTISTEDFPEIEREVQRIVRSNVPFERKTLSKEALLDLYKDNTFKQYFINKNVGNESTIYRNGDFHDLCLGPHLTSTRPIKAMKLLKTSSAYFLNDATKPSLQRVYAISFPSAALLKEYLQRIERAKEMDHRKIGRQMDLFLFHRYSPGSCFWLPDGAHIYNKLVEFLRSEYRKRGFKEVITPNIFSTELWKESGHYDNYRENIYMLESDDFALKPMNCPGHCLIFSSTERSFRELPLRLADFGVLHRNELGGALSGLTRVRRFQQDDAHIFCAHDQIKSEISGCLDFLKFVYSIFGFTYELRLSTRPEKYLGTIEEWDTAEDALRDAIAESKLSYVLNEGDGAFYGPKIDIVLCDALGRKVQCATIQLDFQLPQRFGLRYTGTDGGQHTPIIVHRAILGSIERMIAILIESFSKKLPFWLTPRQIAIIPLYAEEYAAELANELVDYEVRVYDDPGHTLNKRVRSAQTDGFRLICVVGKQELENREINVRAGNKNMNVPFVEFKEIIAKLVREKTEIESIEDLKRHMGMINGLSNLSL